MTDKAFDPYAIKRYQGCDVWNEDGSVAWGCDSGNEAGETAMVMASDYDSLLALYRAATNSIETSREILESMRAGGVTGGAIMSLLDALSAKLS